MVTLGTEGLEFAYAGGPPVFKNLGLRVPAGARLAVLGANGSGKSTLLRCLSGALRPTSGSIVVAGKPVKHSRAGLRAHRQLVQLVTQDPDDQLFSASVREDVSFGPMNLGLPEPEVAVRVDQALGLLAARHLAERPTHQLSFGERKRVAIAGALAMRPGVLILDEPTAGLDPAAGQEAGAALARLHELGTTLVMATHDVDLALAWADQVAVLVGGQLRQGGPAELLGDDALLAAARLRRPWVLSVSAHLHRLGVLPETATPRDEESLLSLLAQQGQSLL